SFACEYFSCPLFQQPSAFMGERGRLRPLQEGDNHMKRISALALLMVASLSAGTLAIAQRPVLKAHIPFDFAMGDSWMPAGDYVITSPNSNLIELRNTDGSARAVVVSLYSHDESKGGSKLEFDKYNERYFLHRVLCPTITSMNVNVTT